MAIEFIEYDKVNILVRKDSEHIATIRNTNKGIFIDSDESLWISDLENILSKMKELQGENNERR